MIRFERFFESTNIMPDETCRKLLGMTPIVGISEAYEAGQQSKMKQLAEIFEELAKLAEWKTR